ncbi:ligase-associated DNA damage response endonuclease PdeM [Bdellovibrio sp. NC01]|uniref:ligase-associated DNA damage response endonuclease PdeM n=1 Tax=Bdellovibrio sp. NC01 TaxID=2220073 RepID=UPI00115A007B|nr:ligase-associated DNA damage response endonuclease PdeM [Bdellovibrio sp. NC01]QDK37264.1 ligase-associated DNA damage response endonuclease PdeM [Bdellovibrio sp. NC01]
MKIQVANEDIELLPEKAFLWQREHLLGLSDVHLGKAESYQSAGVPIPSGSHREDLLLISDLIHRYQIRKVMILGDWIHNRFSLSEIIVQDFREFFKAHDHVHWTLLLGNHEKGSVEILNKLPFHLVEEEMQIGPFLMTHGHKNAKSKLFQIQGHTHPLVSIHEGPTRLKLPCFVLEKNALTIPAFGSLTGGYVIRKDKGKRIFAVTPKEIFEVDV